MSNLTDKILKDYQTKVFIVSGPIFVTKYFLVEIVNKLSDLGKISCGVPQSSILGPLLLFINVIDIPQAIKSNLLLYADDLWLMYQHKDIPKIEKILNEDFENICDWFVDNKVCKYVLVMIKLNQLFSK